MLCLHCFVCLVALCHPPGLRSLDMRLFCGYDLYNATFRNKALETLLASFKAVHSNYNDHESLHYKFAQDTIAGPNPQIKDALVSVIVI